jgi:hypothetical protein
VASRGTEVALFGLFWPRYNGKIHAGSVTGTPFQTVSEEEVSEVRMMYRPRSDGIFPP